MSDVVALSNILPYAGSSTAVDRTLHHNNAKTFTVRAVDARERETGLTLAGIIGAATIL